MPRRRTPATPVPRRRPPLHGRHGRVGRSAVVRPPLPPLHTRIDSFDVIVATAIEFLRGAWPELRDVSVEIGAMPTGDDPDGMPRWHIDRAAKRLILFRVPIERLLVPGHDDAWHRRMAIEGAAFRAAAEYVGREPWAFGDHDHWGHDH